MSNLHVRSSAGMSAVTLGGLIQRRNSRTARQSVAKYSRKIWEKCLISFSAQDFDCTMVLFGATIVAVLVTIRPRYEALCDGWMVEGFESCNAWKAPISREPQ
jgi:hypothetical protein